MAAALEASRGGSTGRACWGPALLCGVRRRRADGTKRLGGGPAGASSAPTCCGSSE